MEGLPLLMLAEKEDSHEREFYSLSEKQICMNVYLPEAAGKRCIEARFGWLLTLANSGEVQLLNPFSRTQIDVPNFKNFPEYASAHGPKNPKSAFIRRAVLSDNPSLTSEFVLVVATFDYLGFWRIGDENWSRIKSMNGENDSNYIKGHKIFPGDVNYYSRDRKFYAVNGKGYIYVWGLGGDLDLGVTEKILSVDEKVAGTCYDGAQPYLVESSKGELLLLVRNGMSWALAGGKLTYGTSKFKVFKIDVTNRECEEITSLEDDAVFVGHNAAFCVSASKFPDVIKPNSVYFTDDSTNAYFIPYYTHCQKCGKFVCACDEEATKRRVRRIVRPEKCPWVWEKRGNLDPTKGGGKNMGVYNFENGSIQRFDPSVETLSLICPPLWLSPSSSS